jgi:pimeloyl-ACP methyl ester carboxylesterase
MNPHVAEVREERGPVDGLASRWHEAPPTAGAAPVLYVHGVPDSSLLWRPFLERTGGFAPDLPGFGDSAKPNGFDYTIEGYRAWLQAFVADRGLDRFSLVVHDWGGGIGLALAQAMPDRVERLVVTDAVPLLPGYRWHWLARQWRRPLLGEMVMGFTFRSNGKKLADRGQRTPLPEAHWDEVWKHFDHGTQRAVLRLYRSAPPDVLARAGARLGDVTAPALVVWGANDPYLSTDFAQAYADALGGEARVRLLEGAGHWPWLDEPALIGEIADFLAG